MEELLTINSILPTTKVFRQSELAEEFIKKLYEKTGLIVFAAYLVRNGKYRHILNLYVDAENSDKIWEKRISTGTWTHDDQHMLIRDVFFGVLKNHQIEPPNDQTLDISLIDLKAWQECKWD